MSITDSDLCAIARAINLAARYLLSKQRLNGSWSDYVLPVGVADQWVTAYVANALANANLQVDIPTMAPALHRSRHWLAECRTFKRGWGYNAAAGADADSTAYAIVFLRSQGQIPRRDDEAFLLSHYCANGGFSTYLRGDAWGRDHPDVTFAAFRALSANEQRLRLTELILYMRSTRTEDGRWPAYWWKTDQYSTYLALELLSDLGFSEYDLFPPLKEKPIGAFFEGAFDLGFAVGIAALRNTEGQLAALLPELLCLQRINGSWPGGPNLRVTNPACFEPWFESNHVYYVDLRSTITTASILRVLVKVAQLHTRASR